MGVERSWGLAEKGRAKLAMSDKVRLSSPDTVKFTLKEIVT